MKTPNIILEVSRGLRKNMTKSEYLIWNFLKGGSLGVKFLRQKPIYVYTDNSGLDRYIIPDFFCFDKKLILEIDGCIHNKKEIYELDKYKEELLINMGFIVLRVTNEEIKNDLNNVIKTIKQYL
ncbi:MAG: endonuclease domain-containing protein [Candidatus Gracilibacteria bacterium]|nr:endonuclease domain-containing protein [Candidatus Gracilibacteria bacterium]